MSMTSPQAKKPRARHKAAIRRSTVSRPISTALGDGVIHKKTTIFDFGCGHGVDVKLLARKGYTIDGWDPHFRPEAHKSPADVVNLGYVLNVIEDPAERYRTLEEAYELARSTLIVSARVDNTFSGEAQYSDGKVSKAGSFQKIYSHSELRQYVESALRTDVQSAGLGMLYVFKDATAEAEYLARRAYGSNAAQYRYDLFEEFGKDKIAKQFVKKWEELGRVPMAEEFAGLDELVEVFGSVSRVENLAAIHLDLGRIDRSKQDRKSDVLTFLAGLMLRGIKISSLRSLPRPVQADIKANWASFPEAQRDAHDFLFSVGDEEVLREAVSSASVGKLLSDDFYVHVSAENELPPVLRLLIFAAKNIVGEFEHDLVKFRLDGKSLSFLVYENFDQDPHPRLSYSIRVYLPKADYSGRDYTHQSNRPILHRKELMVDETYPYYEKFKQLTQQEDAAGILEVPNTGYEQQWRTALLANKLAIRDHKLVRTK